MRLLRSILTAYHNECEGIYRPQLDDERSARNLLEWDRSAREKRVTKQLMAKLLMRLSTDLRLEMERDDIWIVAKGDSEILDKSRVDGVK